MLKFSIRLEAQHTLNQFVPNSITLEYVEQNYANFCGEIGKSKIIPEDFNTSFFINRIHRKIQNM